MSLLCEVIHPERFPEVSLKCVLDLLYNVDMIERSVINLAIDLE